MPKKQKKYNTVAVSNSSNSVIVSSTEWNLYQKEIAMTLDALIFTLQKYARALTNDLNSHVNENKENNGATKNVTKKSNQKKKYDKKIRIQGREKLPCLIIEKRALGKENEKLLLMEKFFRSFQRHLTTREMEMIILRYLISDKFEISKTIDNCIKTAEFRRREHLHRMLLFPSLIPLCGYDEANICKTLKLQYGADTTEPPLTLSLSGLPVNSMFESSVPAATASTTTSTACNKNFTATACTSVSTNAGNTDTNTATMAEFGYPSQFFTNSCNGIDTIISPKSCSKEVNGKLKNESNSAPINKNNSYNTSSVSGGGNNNDDDDDHYYNVDYLTLYSTPLITNNKNNIIKNSVDKTAHLSQIANSNSSNAVTQEVELPLASASLISAFEDSTVHSCISQDNSLVSANRRSNSADDDDKHSHLLSRILGHLPFTWRHDKESKSCPEEVNGSVRCNNITRLAQGGDSTDAKNTALCSEDNISFSNLLRNDGRSLTELNKADNMTSARNDTTADSRFKANAHKETNFNLTRFRPHRQDRSYDVGRERSASASASTSATSTTTTTSHGLDFSMNESEDRSERLYKQIEQTTHGRGKRLPTDENKVKYLDPAKNINRMENHCNIVDVHAINKIHDENERNNSIDIANNNSNNKNNSKNSYNNMKTNEVNSSVAPGNGGTADGDDGDADSNIVLDYHPLLEPIISTILRHVPITFHYWDKKGHPVMYCKFAMLRSRLLTDELFHLTPLGSEPVALCALFQAYTLELTQQLIRYKDYQNMSYNEMIKALELPCTTTTNNNNSTTNTSILPKRSHVETCVVVLDCANVQYRHLLYRPLLRMMRTVVKLSQEHWPELLHHIYVVNCHKIIRLAYLLIKNTLLESTRRKITFCDRQYTSMTLREVIDKEFLPQEYGGSCNCMGGCLKVGSTSIKDDDDDDDNDDNESSSATVSSMQTNTLRENVTPTLNSPREEDDISWVSERSSRRLSQRQPSQMSFARDTHFSRTARKFVIRPRQRQSLTFAVNNKEEIIWEFAVKRRRLVSFSAVFIPADGGGAIYSLAATRKVYEDANHYVCPCAGTIVFKWKNEVYFGHRAHLHVKVYRDNFSNDEGATST